MNRRILFRWFGYVAAFFCAYVPLPDIIAPFRPNIVLIAVVYWTLVYGKHIALTEIALLGLLSDAALQMPLGVHVAAYGLIVIAIAGKAYRIKQMHMLQQGIIVGICALSYTAYTIFVHTLLGVQLLLYGIWLTPLLTAVTWMVCAAPLLLRSQVRNSRFR